MTRTEPFQIANPELRRGEKVIWADRPGPGARARSRIAHGLFGMVFFSFAIFWIGEAWQPDAPIFFPLFGLPFVLVGLGIMLSPLWAWWEAKNWLIYVLTDQRIMIIRLFPRHKVETFGPDDITKMERTTSPDGSGNLIFHEEITRNSKGGVSKKPRGFYGIQDVRNVENAVRKLAEGPDERSKNNEDRHSSPWQR
jgi:hypothetical protein